MSRSVAKHKKYRAGNDKEYRTLANRKLRQKTAHILKKEMYESVIPILKEVSDVWDFPSDGGSIYIKNLNIKFMRR